MYNLSDENELPLFERPTAPTAFSISGINIRVEIKNLINHPELNSKHIEFVSQTEATVFVFFKEQMRNRAFFSDELAYRC